MLKLLKGFFVAAFLIQLSDCHSDGAGTEACVSLLPIHGAFGPQTSPAPYTITPSATSVSQGQSVTLTISRTNTAVFVRGFIIQARNAANAVVGQFFLTTGMRILACPTFPVASVATHGYSDARPSINIVWIAPTTFLGPVNF